MKNQRIQKLKTSEIPAPKFTPAAAFLLAVFLSFPFVVTVLAGILRILT